MSARSRFKPGDMVEIRCAVRPGAFPDEHLVEIETDTDTISGFVKASFLSRIKGDLGFVQGKVIKVSGNAVTVQIPGSFFTRASGVTSVSPGWANSNLQHATA